MGLESTTQQDVVHDEIQVVPDVTPEVRHHEDATGGQEIPVFQIDGLNVYYGPFRAVRDVTMTVCQHEVTPSSGRPAAERPCCDASTA